MRMVKIWYVRSLALTERLILNSRLYSSQKKKRRQMLTSLLTLRDIHVCSTGLYKLSQKGLWSWSDTSPWCSLSERARTLIYNSLLVTRLTPIFFFFFCKKERRLSVLLLVKGQCWLDLLLFPYLTPSNLLDFEMALKTAHGNCE